LALTPFSIAACVLWGSAITRPHRNQVGHSLHSCKFTSRQPGNAASQARQRHANVVPGFDCNCGEGRH
jgi:hypothetical protein